jgi:IS30 family transposase
MTPELIALIDQKLALYQWSPEQIAGWLKKEHPESAVSHERIYQHIWQNKKQGGLLFQNLRRHGRKYFKRSNGKTTRGRIIGRVDISERPEIVETRERFGDWEADTVVGKGRNSALVTVVERKSRYTKIVRVTRATADRVCVALSECLRGLPVETITFDNGKEFAYHLAAAEALEAKTYFAQPYHSWERGLNENTNGLIRQYFPKGTDFDTVSDEEVARVEALLNSRPRKCLGYDTPEGVLPRAA